jgi:mannan endo-1,4-beta-mannosidase
MEKAVDYINQHLTVAKRLNKPLVIEEFGLPRNNQSFDINSSTSLRDEYYGNIFSILAENAKTNGHLAGAAFWAFGGTARPVKNQIFWKAGDDYMGDPPMEEQGLNTVFDSDKSTWKMINSFSKSLSREKASKN